MAICFPKNEVCSGSISIATEVDAWIEYYVITYKTIGKKSLVLIYVIPTLLKWRDPKLTNLIEEIFLVN